MTNPRKTRPVVLDVVDLKRIQTARKTIYERTGRYESTINTVKIILDAFEGRGER